MNTITKRQENTIRKFMDFFEQWTGYPVCYTYIQHKLKLYPDCKKNYTVQIFYGKPEKTKELETETLTLKELKQTLIKTT